MLRYDYAKSDIEILEQSNRDDYQFNVRLVGDGIHPDSLRKLRDYFNQDQVHTDVLCYAQSERDYMIIVRKDYYDAFLIAMFKFRLIRSLEWTD